MRNTDKDKGNTDTVTHTHIEGWPNHTGNARHLGILSLGLSFPSFAC